MRSPLHAQLAAARARADHTRARRVVARTCARTMPRLILSPVWQEFNALALAAGAAFANAVIADATVADAILSPTLPSPTSPSPTPPTDAAN